MPAWSDDIPHFDELYSVSDLHMGGLGPGAQIFDSGPRLATLIDYLRTRPGAVGLVINGDIVDFLAEPDAKPFDPDGATRKLDRIAGDPAFQPVWNELRRFVRTKGRRLVVTLGNHDLELALPWVREHLLGLLAGDNDAARGRIMLEFQGSGFLCRVGNATVLCVHGNEVDDWNVTDYEAIRRIGRDLQQGREVDPWTPNAGTHLVVNVMNAIKRVYPFVDLLKPELEAVIPVLLAVAPEKRNQIAGAIPVFRRLMLDKVRRATGLLGAEDRAEALARVPDIQLPVRQHVDGSALMTLADERLLRGVASISLLSDIERSEQLGLRDAAWNLVSGGDLRETLRRALEKLQSDRSFDWWQEDDTFRQFDKAVGSNIDFVVTGHTHLERALPGRKTRAFYLNSGTWVRLIRLEPRVLADQTEFNKVYDALAAGTLAALDQVPDLVLRRHTVVAVRASPEGCRGELLHWTAAGARYQLTPVAPNAGMTRT